MLTHTNWDLESALYRMGAPEFVSRPAPVHPFTIRHDGSHGWTGPAGRRKKGAAKRQKQARKAQRRFK